MHGATDYTRQLWKELGAPEPSKKWKVGSREALQKKIYIWTSDRRRELLWFITDESEMSAGLKASLKSTFDRLGVSLIHQLDWMEQADISALSADGIFERENDPVVPTIQTVTEWRAQAKKESEDLLLLWVRNTWNPKVETESEKRQLRKGLNRRTANFHSLRKFFW